MPNLAVVRPADANETSAAWRATLHQRGPVGLILTRQNVPVLDSDAETVRTGVARGGYVVRDSDDVQVLLIATGSEVQLALSAADALEADGIGARVVSMPCLEWFEQQDRGYRDTVLPPSVRARVSVEAGATLGWWKYVGDAGRVIGVDHFGASGDPAILFREFGVTSDDIVRAARESIADASRH